MAFSHLTTNGQSAIVCQLCENEPKIKWKCMECSLMMCQRCRDKVHPKFPSATDHTIIDIKDVGKQQVDSRDKLDFSNLKCRSHAQQNCCLFCVDCDVIVCPSCITSTHKRHDLIDINVGYKTKVEMIKTRAEYLENEIETVSKREEEFRKIKYQYQISVTETKQEITDFENAIINAVKKNTGELLQEVDEEAAIEMSSFTGDENEVTETRKTLTKQMEEVIDLGHSRNIEKVFAVSGAFLTLHTVPTKPIRKLKPPSKFVSGNIANISKTFGSLKSFSTADPVAKDDELVLGESIMTHFKEIGNIIVCKNDYLWLNDFNGEILHKVKVVGNTVKTVSKHECLHVADMVMASNGDIYITANDCSIKIISSATTELIDTNYNISPWVPTAVCLTHDNKLVIGAKVRGVEFLSKGGRVIVMDQSGQEEVTIWHDRKNNPLFNGVFRIAPVKSIAVAVLDLLAEDGHGRIVIMDLKGKIKNIYTGHEDVNGIDRLFKPRAIVSTKSDYFIVADYWNHALHILNQEGEFVTYYNTGVVGISSPWSLCVSETGHLYIGCKTFDENTDNSNVYITKRTIA